MSIDPGITSRIATNDDRERIQALVFSVLQEFGLRGDPEGTDRDLNDIEANYADRGGVFEVIEDAAGNLLGTIGLYPVDAETVELRKMYFVRDLRGFGRGQKTVARAIERAREMGFKKIYLETASVLQAAIHIYEKFGFKPTGSKRTPRCDQPYVLILDDKSDESSQG